MPVVTSQILKSVDFTKTQNSKYLENETSEVKAEFLYQCLLELTYFVYDCLVGQRKRGRDRDGKGGGSNEQHLSDKPPLIQCGETYCTWQ